MQKAYLQPHLLVNDPTVGGTPEVIDDPTLGDP